MFQAMKGVSGMEQEIVEILQAVGVYEQVRRKVSSDAELVRLFDQDFEKLVEQVQK